MVDGVIGQVKYIITVIGEHTNKHGPAYVFKADWQDSSLEPQLIAFKVFKNLSTTPDGFLRDARNWKRELQVLRKIRHVSRGHLPMCRLIWSWTAPSTPLHWA